MFYWADKFSLKVFQLFFLIFILGSRFPIISSGSFISLRSPLLEPFVAEYSSRGPQALVLQKREVEQPGTDFLDGGSKRRRKSRTSLAITSAARSTTDGDVRRSGGIDRFRSKTVSPFGDRAALFQRTDTDERVGKTDGRKIGARRQKQ